MTNASINLPFITADATGPKHLDYLFPEQNSELTADLVEATMEPVRQALKDSGLQIGDLSKVLLVGWFYQNSCCSRGSKETNR